MLLFDNKPFLRQPRRLWESTHRMNPAVPPKATGAVKWYYAARQSNWFLGMSYLQLDKWWYTGEVANNVAKILSVPLMTRLQFVSPVVTFKTMCLTHNHWKFITTVCPFALRMDLVVMSMSVPHQGYITVPSAGRS